MTEDKKEKKASLSAKKSEGVKEEKFTGKYFEAVGRRKTSTARVRIYPDKKQRIIVNGKPHQEFLPGDDLIIAVESPLKAVGMMDVSISIVVKGGGVRGQAEAIQHGISRALLKIDKDLRPTLKPLGFLSRDSRRKERKKPGLKKARKAPQWSKR